MPLTFWRLPFRPVQASVTGQEPGHSAGARKRRFGIGRGRGAHPVRAFVAAFIVVFGGSELAVHAAASKLPEPMDYFAATAQSVVDDMDILRAAGVHSQLTFVGTSMVRRGVDANRMEKELDLGPTSVHNVALPGAQTRIVERWLLEEVVPRLHPKRVVWGISSLDFNANRPNPPFGLYQKARATQRGFYGDADRLMGRLALSEHREAVRSPLVLADAASGTAKKFEEKRKLADRATWRIGGDEITPAALVRLRRGHAITVRTKQLHDYAVGPDDWSAFVDTLAALKRANIEVVVVVMPVTTGYLSFHPRGPAQFQEWKQRVTAEGRRQNVLVLDMSRTMPDSAFRDYEHLWSASAKNTFTPMLAKRLRSLGW